MFSAEQLAAAVGCPLQVAARWAAPLQRAMTRCGITTRRRAAHFLAQIGHESAGLTRTEENLNYNARRLREVWPSRFSADAAADYARHPERIANRVYANRMGNGSEASGDGWRFRGRSPIQLTGRDNYRHLAQLTGLPLVAMPSLAAEVDEGALIAATWWQANGLNTLADSGDILAVSRRVNLGTINTTRTPNGLQDRIARTRRAADVLGEA
ncbi:glycoside hydrolase family 19 protein [Thermomonas fusca]